MKSEVVLPLYDTENGGPAQAFKCLLPDFKTVTARKCGVVTRTLRGMRSHQLYAHAFKPQQKMFREGGTDAIRSSSKAGAASDV